MNIEERVMTLARQHCQLNTHEWPEDYEVEKPENPDVLKTAWRREMDRIDTEIGRLTAIDPWLVTSYYWNCVYEPSKTLTPEEWIKWIFFGKVTSKDQDGNVQVHYTKENGVFGYGIK